MMTRRALLAGVAALALLPAPGAFAIFASTAVVPSGHVVSESRTAGGYAGIAVSIPGTIIIRQAASESVKVEADDNLMPEIETVVERGTLKIRFRHSLNITGRSAIRVLVTGPTFDSLALSGSGDIVSGALKAGALDVAIAGSGDVRIANLEAEKVKVSIAGSGNFRVAGRAASVTASIAGSGDIDAGRLQATRAKISIAGSGNATLWAGESLAASIVGSGDVRYHGDPAITKRIAGSGSLKRLGPAP